MEMEALNFFTRLIASHKVDLFSSISNSDKVEGLVVVQGISNEDIIVRVYKDGAVNRRNEAKAGTGVEMATEMALLCRACLVSNHRSSYHSVSQIWPIGYKSCWHDKIIGSLFISEVSDGGEFGPVFKVTRRSCSAVPIPEASNVLCRPKPVRPEPQNEEKHYDMTFRDTDYDGDLSFLMFLSEPSPPGEDDILTCLGTRSSKCLISQSSNIEGSPVLSDNLVLRDEIGDFSVEGSSSSLAES